MFQKLNCNIKIQTFTFYRFVVLCIIVLALQIVSFGQSKAVENPKTTQVETVQDSTPAKRNTFFTIFNGKPGKAAFYGLIIPSGGQVYNKRWWKVPLALGIDGFLFYRANTLQKQYKQLDKDFKLAQSGPQPPLFLSPFDIKIERDAIREKKEYAWVFLVIGHIVTIFDAYADRHLIDFDMSDDLTMKYFAPQSAFETPSFGFSMPIKTGKNKPMLLLVD